MKNYIMIIIGFSLFLTAKSWTNVYFPKIYTLDGTWQYHVQHQTRHSRYVYQFKGDEPRMSLPQNWYLHKENHAGVMWFQRKIQMKNLAAASQHYIEFTGVDYFCELWVNDQYVGAHEGYFQTFDFDISPYLRQGDNSIKVKVNTPLENYPEHYSLHKTLLRGIFSHHDTRPGGAWSAEGQDRNSGGIWNHIAIKSYKGYKINHLRITPKVVHQTVDLKIRCLIEKLLQKRRTSFLYYQAIPSFKTLEVRIEPSNFKGKKFSQTFTFSAKKLTEIKMHLEEVELWYTHDRGFPHLYTVTLRVGDTEIQRQIGFRSLKQDKQKKYTLNGEALYLKGTNYISSQYMSEMSEEKLKKDLLLMQKAHINTIRVHAHIEPQRFYTLCDEMGFLVWQDYNLQWGYIDTKAFQNEAIKQAKEMVDQLYHHPSIYMWSMHNEPPWNSDWMQWKYPDYNDTINKNLDTVLYKEMLAYDDYHLIKKLSSNLEHPWFGWYSGKYQDFIAPSKVPVISEYGAQAIPKMSSLQKFIPKKYLLPKRKKAKKYWEYHNYQFNWNEKNGVKLTKDTATLIHDSQSYQAKLIKFATEMLRIQKYQGTTAIFQFMFNEGWPSMNWGIVDYYRTPKLGYKALKEAFAPIIVVTKQTLDNILEFYVVNDTLETFPQANLHIRVDSNGTEKVYDYRVDIAKDSVLKVDSVWLEKESIVDMTLTHPQLKITNHYDLKMIKAKKKKGHL